MSTALAGISSQIQNSFKGEFDGISFSTEAHLSIANSMDDVNDSDHIFALADISGEGLNGEVAGGANNFGGKVAFIDADYFSGSWDTNIGNTGQQTAAHEFGHLAGLKHTTGIQPFNLMKSGAGNNWFAWGLNLNSSQLKSIYNNKSLNRGNNYEYVPYYSNGWQYKKMPNRGLVAPIIKY
jgi:hypothetical protein